MRSRGPVDARGALRRRAGLVVCAALSIAARAGALERPTPGPRDVQAFFDEYLPARMKAHNVAGAVVAVVRDGEVILAKGYGEADVARKVPMDPDRTVCILGSLSKLFTWTAVMQLAERGEIDLDADVTRYLAFGIPDTFAEPITLRHIMDHTAGFDDDKYDQMTPTAAGLVPLQTWLRTHVPARVRPPGS
jgi:CubicO group peptidase (beta-lactamase class C family)